MSQRSDRKLKIDARRSTYPVEWFIEDDEPMPQSWKHDQHAGYIKALFDAWVHRIGRPDLIVGRELAFRADEDEPRAGVDPDIYITEKPPVEESGDIRSVRTWEDDNYPPLVAVEVVSLSRPKKDYSLSPERHAWLGTQELWIFDPLLCGRWKDHKPVLLQLFERETNHELVQTYAGPGPMFSRMMDAWVSVIDDHLVISYDREGKSRWHTLEEEANLRADEANLRADAERAEKERVMARNAELEALLAKLQGTG